MHRELQCTQVELLRSPELGGVRHLGTLSERGVREGTGSSWAAPERNFEKSSSVDLNSADCCSLAAHSNLWSIRGCCPTGKV